MPGALAAPQLCNRFWALQLGMGKTRAQRHSGLPPASSGQQLSGPAAERGSTLLPTPATFIPGLQVSSEEGLGGCREPYLQKNECRKEKLQPPSHSQRDTISEVVRYHALIGLGMATAPKSSCLL